MQSGTQLYARHFDEHDNLVAVHDGNGRETRYEYDDTGRLTASHYPDGTAEHLEYDERGRLVRRTKRDGQAISYAYDVKDRLTAASWNGAEIRHRKSKRPGDGGRNRRAGIRPQSGWSAVVPTARCFRIRHRKSKRSGIRYTYDAEDRLIEAESPACRSCYRYDDEGRVVKEERTIAGKVYLTRYRYDRQGRLAAVRAPGSRYWQRYAYDGIGRLSRLGLAGHRADLRFAYNGTNLKLTYPNGLWAQYEMSNPLNVERITVKSTGDAPVLDLCYTTDGRGNITQINEERYTYDERDRLVAYSDPAGNQRRVGDRHSSQAANPTCTYDRNGNLVTKVDGLGLWEYAYDVHDQLVAVQRDGYTVAEYAYDHRGRRVLKRTPRKTVVYHHDLHGFCLGESEDGRLVRLNLGTANSILGRVHLDGDRPRIEYYHHDHLASVRAVSDESGQVQARFDFEPFGEPREPVATDCEPIFAGKTLDAESGLYYFGARYYDPVTGRFLTADSYTFGPDDERLRVPRPAEVRPPAWRHLPSFWRAGSGIETERERAEDRQRELMATWLQADLHHQPHAYAHGNPLKYVDVDGHQAGWYLLYSILAFVWAIPYTVGAFVSWEIWFNWIFYVLIAFAWAWDRDAADNFPYEYEGHSEDRLGAWGWFINGGLAGKMVMGGAFTQGNIIIGKWDALQARNDTDQNFAVPTDPDLSNLVTARRAADVHELRHTNQFAWWGPLMMPWVLLAYYLANLIFISASIGLATPFSETARDTFVDIWTAQWDILKEAWVGLLISIPFLPGTYWWDYIGSGGYSSCWHERDAFRHSGYGPNINTIITAMENSLNPGGTTLVTVAYDSNAVAGGYTSGNASSIPVPTIDPNNSGATIAAEPAFDAAITAGDLVNLRVFEYTAGPTAGTDRLTVTYGGTTAALEISVE